MQNRGKFHDSSGNNEKHREILRSTAGKEESQTAVGIKRNEV